MLLGTKLKIKRLEKNLSQEYMASVLNISQSYYNKIENNQAKLKVDNFIEIAKILDADITELLLSTQPNFSNNFKVNLGQIGSLNTLNNNFPEEERKLYQNRIDELENQNSFLKFVIEKFEIPFEKHD